MAYSYCEKSAETGVIEADVTQKIMQEKQRIRDEIKVVHAVEVLQDKPKQD